MDVLFCSAGSADPVDRGLVQLNDEGLVHVVDCRKLVLLVAMMAGKRG
jgi:hypothetical protein